MLNLRPLTPYSNRHITYFSWLDNNAFTLESGKYFEVVGHMRFDVNQNHQINQFNYEWVNTSRSTASPPPLLSLAPS